MSPGDHMPWLEQKAGKVKISYIQVELESKRRTTKKINGALKRMPSNYLSLIPIIHKPRDYLFKSHSKSNLSSKGESNLKWVSPVMQVHASIMGT